MQKSDLSDIRAISILDVAAALGIEIRNRKAMCIAGHDERTPSLVFYPLENRWHCFGCGMHGDAIDLVQETMECGFKEAVSWLRKAFPTHSSEKEMARGTRSWRKRTATPFKGMDGSRGIDYKPDPEVYEWFLNHCRLSPSGLDYLVSRGFWYETVSHFRVGELRSPATALQKSLRKWGLPRLEKAGLVRTSKKASGALNRTLVWWERSLILPFFKGGEVVYLQGRRLSGEGPKYMGPVGIEKPLFNREVLRDMNPGDQILICEGATDVMAAHQHGYNAIGVLGATSFRSAWVSLVMPFQVCVVPDNDSAGSQFAQRVKAICASKGKIVHELRVPDGKDLAECLLEAKA